MTGDDRAVGAPERLHPLVLLTGLGGSLRGVAGGYAFIGYLAVSGRLMTALIAAAALLVMLMVGLFIYWRRFEFRVGRNEIRIDSGIVSRTHRSIPFDRIQDVEIVQGPLARLLGLAKVKFETGGAAGGREDEGSLQAIALGRAQEIRELIRGRRGSVVEEHADPAEEERPPVFAMDTPRVLLAGLFNFSLALFAGLFGLSQTVGDLLGFDPFQREFWAELLSVDHPLAQFLMQHQVAAIAAGVALLVLVGILTGVIRSLLRDYRFRLDRTGAGLRRRRGLLTKSDVTLPASRAQAAIVATGPVRSAFGWRELKLQSLARDEGGKGDHMLAPLATDEEVGDVLTQFGWRPLGDAIEWQPISRAYVWMLALALVPVVLIAAGQAAFYPLLGAAILAVVAIAILVRFVAWRRTRYARDGDRLLIRTGWWRRRTLVLPIRRIQSIDFSQTFVGRWFGAAELRFGVAGGSGFSAHIIPALDEKNARALREQLLVQLR